MQVFVQFENFIFVVVQVNIDVIILDLYYDLIFFLYVDDIYGFFVFSGVIFDGIGDQIVKYVIQVSWYRLNVQVIGYVYQKLNVFLEDIFVIEFNDMSNGFQQIVWYLGCYIKVLFKVQQFIDVGDGIVELVDC